MKQKTISFLLLLFMAMILPQDVMAARIFKNHLEGSDCIYWEISDDGILKIGSSGKKIDYSHCVGTFEDCEGEYEDAGLQTCPDFTESPFLKYKDRITTIIMYDEYYGEIMNIGKNMFNGLNKVKEVYLPHTIRTIGESAFCNCSSLTKIEQSGSYTLNGKMMGRNFITTSIEKNAFFNCKSLICLNINAPKLATIKEWAFANCTSLFYIPNDANVVNIEEYAFYNCGMTQVCLPKLVTLGKFAFNNCKNILSVKSLGSLAELPKGAFMGCEKLIQFYYFPATLKRLNEKCLAKTDINSLKIPSTVSYIEKGVLAGCDNLTSLTIPFVGSMAINATHKSDLEKVTSFSHLFNDESNDRSKEYQVNDTETGEYVYVPSSLTEVIVTGGNIETNAFKGMAGLKSIQMKENVSFSFRNHNIFENCKSLETIQLPSSAIYSEYTSIGNRMFMNCEALKDIILPSNIQYIGQMAFYGCTNLNLDGKFNNVIQVYESAFYGCEGLTSFSFAENIGTGRPSLIEQAAFKNCKNLKNVGLNGIERISEQAFMGCSSLTEINNTTSLATINSEAFRGCSSLDVINIPRNLVTIKCDAFLNCSNLATINVDRPTTFTIDEEAFDHRTYNNAVLYVQNTDFMTTDGWKNFQKKYAVSSSCGVGVSYTLKDGVLTIKGDGICSDYTTNDGEGAPWNINSSTNDVIKKVVFEGNIRNIGAHMFENCVGITEIIIPNSVTSIGDAAFWQCTGLKSVRTYGNSQLETIGSGAFWNCTALSEVALSGKLKTIKSSAFRQCYALETIDLPESIESFGAYAFCYCTNLKSVKLPKGAYLKRSVFSNCTKLTDVTISEDATEIPESSFSDCTSLKSVTIPASVKKVLSYAFSGCTSLESINMESLSAPAMAVSAFDEETMNSATLYTYDKTAYSADEKWGTFANISAFIEGNIKSTGTDVDNLHYELVKDELIVSKTDDTSGYSSSSFGIQRSAPLVEVNAGLATMAKSVTVEEGVTGIGSNFFEGMNGVETITLPSTLTVLGKEAFTGCTNLKSIYVKSENLNVVGAASSDGSGTEKTDDMIADDDVYSKATVYCSDPDRFRSDESMWAGFGANIKAYKVGYCNSSKRASYVLLDDTLTITANEFNGFSDYSSSNHAPWYSMKNYVKHVVINNGDSKFTVIPQYAFYYMENVESVVLPETITQIGSYAFNGCSALEEITIPEGVNNIGSYSFTNCKSLGEIELPSTLTSIGAHAFNGCSSLSSIAVPDGVTAINNYTFYNCTNLSNVVLSDNITSINERAFASCSSLASINMPASLKTIGNFAFSYSSNLRNINLPASLETIGNGAFYGANPVSIRCHAANTPSVGSSNVFSKAVNILVNRGCGEAYESAFSAYANATVRENVLDLTDAAHTLVPGVYEAGEATFTRNVTKGNFTVFCLPFNARLATDNGVAEMYVPTGYALYNPKTAYLTLMLKKVLEKEFIPAGTAVIAKTNADQVKFENFDSISFASINEITEPTDIAFDVYEYDGQSGFMPFYYGLDIRYFGNYEPATLGTENLYNFTKNGGFGMAKNNVMSSYRTYMTVANAADDSAAKIAGITLGFEDETTGIVSVIGELKNDGCVKGVYSIDGKKVNDGTSAESLKGVFIMNGKKIVK